MTRALVVGLGNPAVDHYIPTLLERGLEVAVLSRTPAKTAAVAERFGVTALSWSDAGAFGAEVAFNVSTDSQHAVVLDALMDAGIPEVLTEKPLVSAGGQEHVTEDDFIEATRLAARAADAGTRIALGFNYRFFETSRRALEVIASGGIGAPTNVIADMHHACLSHTIDLVHAAAGPIDSLTALQHPASDLPPSRAIAFTTTGGAVGTFTLSSARSWDDRLFTVAVLGERGRVSWSDLDSGAEHFDAATGYRTTTALGGGLSRWDRYAASFRASITAYLDALDAGAPVPVPLAAGLRELQVEAAIVRSLREARTVRAQEEFPITA